MHQDVSEALNGPAYYLGWNESYVEAAYRNNPVPTTGATSGGGIPTPTGPCCRPTPPIRVQR